MDKILNGSILMQTVNNIIVQFTNQNKVFTAFDITQKIRGDGVLAPVHHFEVKELIFQCWKDTFCDEYERTLTELNIIGKKVYAYVYHPETISATTHPLAVQSNTVIDIANINIPYRTVELTSCEKRLSIPKKMLKRLNWVAGHFVFLDMNDTRKIVIRKNDNSNNNNVLSINADGRLRISKSELNKVFAENVEEFNVFLIEDKEIIEIIPV